MLLQKFFRSVTSSRSVYPMPRYPDLPGKAGSWRAATLQLLLGIQVVRGYLIIFFPSKEERKYR